MITRVNGSKNLQALVYILSSLGILSYDDFKRSSSGMFSPKLEEDIRSWKFGKKIQVEFSGNGSEKVYYIDLNLLCSQGSEEQRLEKLNQCQTFLEHFSFVLNMSNSKFQDLLYVFLNYNQYEIGDSIALNSKAVGLFLWSEVKVNGQRN